MCGSEIKTEPKIGPPTLIDDTMSNDHAQSDNEVSEVNYFISPFIQQLWTTQ